MITHAELSQLIATLQTVETLMLDVARTALIEFDPRNRQPDSEAVASIARHLEAMKMANHANQLKHWAFNALKNLTEASHAATDHSPARPTL